MIIVVVLVLAWLFLWWVVIKMKWHRIFDDKEDVHIGEEKRAEKSMNHLSPQTPPQTPPRGNGTWDISDPNDADLQFRLGVSQGNSVGVPPNYKKAAEHFSIAAKQGHAAAQFNLGLCYERGLGTLQDPVSAHCFYNLSASNGHASAGESRDRIAKAMTPAQIAQAQDMARQWLKNHPAK